MEEEISQKSFDSNYPRRSLNDNRSFNAPFCSDQPSILRSDRDNELLHIIHAFQNLLNLVKSTSPDKQKEKEKAFHEFSRKFNNLQKVQLSVTRVCEEIFKGMNRNLIIAAHHTVPGVSARMSEQTPNDMVIIELQKKREKLERILKTLKEMELLEDQNFRVVKGLIFEGVEKLMFAIKIREIQLLNHRNTLLSFSRHDSIVKNVLTRWKANGLISLNEENNAGTFYAKLDSVEDFLFELSLICYQQAQSPPKNRFFEEMSFLIDYCNEFLSIMNEVRVKYAQEYKALGGLMWILREKAYYKKDLMNFIVMNLLESVSGLRGFLGNSNEGFLKKYELLCHSVIRELKFQARMGKIKTESCFPVYECLSRMGLVNEAFKAALSEQEPLIISKIYCQHNIGASDIKHLMQQNDDFLRLFIDFYLAFWKYHTNQNKSLNSEFLKEFRLFVDFPEFASQIQEHLNRNYPEIAWILKIKSTFEDGDPEEAIELEVELGSLIKKQQNVRMRKLLCEYWKACVVLGKKERDTRFIDGLMSIDEIQINYTKTTKLLNLMGIINELKEGNFDSNTKVLQSLNLLKSYLDLKQSKEFPFPAFQENEDEVLKKILKVSLDLDKEKLEAIVKFLKDKLEDKERLHFMIHKLNLWSNYPKFREIMARMWEDEWSEVQPFLSEAVSNQEDALYLEFVFGYINNFYEQGLLN